MYIKLKDVKKFNNKISQMVLNIFCLWWSFLGHDQLLEFRLLEKSARHDFIITRQRLSNNYFCVNCSNPVNLWESTGFEQFHFKSKKYQLLELQMVDKDVENVNCSTQFIVKKMVYMYGS